MQHQQYHILYFGNSFIRHLYIVSIDLYMIFRLWCALRNADIKEGNMETVDFYAFERMRTY